MHSVGFSHDVVMENRAAANSIAKTRIHGGLPRNYADMPPRMCYGPLQPIVRLDGSVIDWDCRDHPYHESRRNIWPLRFETVIAASYDSSAFGLPCAPIV